MAMSLAAGLIVLPGSCLSCRCPTCHVEAPLGPERLWTEIDEAADQVPPAPASSSGALLIIAHEDFITQTDALRLLAEWKNGTGMTTYLVSWQRLVSRFHGYDEPERIKRGIAHYYERRHVRYVLLVGDCDMFPVRYIRLDMELRDGGGTYSDFYYSPCDLYYADLFDEEGNFQTWDADGNNIFGELWGMGILRGLGPINHDMLDLVPDVMIGRIPASTVSEVENYVVKVIAYEWCTGHRPSSDYRALVSATDRFSKNAVGSVGDTIGVVEQLRRLGYQVVELYHMDPLPGWAWPGLKPCVDNINRELPRVRFASLIGHGNPSAATTAYPLHGRYAVYWARSKATATGLFGANNTKTLCRSFCPDLTGLIAVGDFDGDGYDDAAFITMNEVRVYLNNYTPRLVDRGVWAYGDFWVYWAYPYYRPMTGDVDGDGDDDLVIFGRSTGSACVLTSDPAAREFDDLICLPNFCLWSRGTFVGDFDGDGMADLGVAEVENENLAIYIALSEGTAFEPKALWLTLGPEAPWHSNVWTILAGEFTGDDREDLAFITYDGKVYVAKSMGPDHYFRSPELRLDRFLSGRDTREARVLVGDMTGDGLSDLVLFLRDARIGIPADPGTKEGTEWGYVYVAASNGQGFEDPMVWNYEFYDSEQERRRYREFCLHDEEPGVGDFDGDGIDDIATFVRIRGDPFDGLSGGYFPVMFVESCLTAKFAPLPPIDGYVGVDGTTYGSKHRFPTRVPVIPRPLQSPETDRNCIAEDFLLFSGKGAVAYIGGVQVLQGGPGIVANYLHRKFYEGYALACAGELPSCLGDVWNYSIHSYLVHYGLGRYDWPRRQAPSDDKGAAAAVHAYHQPLKVALFGDPSLRLNGLENRPPFFRSSHPTSPQDICRVAGCLEVQEGQRVLFDATRYGFCDPDGDRLWYRWDFNGDGEWDTSWSTDPRAWWTYPDDRPEVVMVAVQAMDTHGRCSPKFFQPVRILNVPPTVRYVWAVEVRPDRGRVAISPESPGGPPAVKTVSVMRSPFGMGTVIVRFGASVSDPGEDELTFSWSFGRGAEPEESSERQVEVEFQGPEGGEREREYHVQLTVDDGDGGRATGEIIIRVVVKTLGDVIFERGISGPVVSMITGMAVGSVATYAAMTVARRAGLRAAMERAARGARRT